MEFKNQNVEAFHNVVEYVKHFRSTATYAHKAFVEFPLDAGDTVLTYRIINNFGRVILVTYAMGCKRLSVDEGYIDLYDPDHIASLITAKTQNRSCTTRLAKNGEMDEVVGFIDKLCHLWQNRNGNTDPDLTMFFYEECVRNAWVDWTVKPVFLDETKITESIRSSRDVEYILDCLCRFSLDDVTVFMNKARHLLNFSWTEIVMCDLTPENCGKVVDRGVKLGYDVKVDIKNGQDSFIVGFYKDDVSLLDICGMEDDLDVWKDFFRCTADKIVENDELYEAFKVLKQDSDA